MTGDNALDDVFEDAENDPLWIQAGLMVDAPPKPAQGCVTISLAWLARVFVAVRTTSQLIVAMLIYRECHLSRSNTVALSNGKLEQVGISRYAKYRALTELSEAGIIEVEATDLGRSVRVKLIWFP